MSTDTTVSVRIADNAEGELVARVMFSDVAFTVHRDAIAYTNGILRIAIPAWIDAPLEATIVERWFPPTDEQVRLAVEALDAAAIERLLLREMNATAGESWGVIARRAVALASAGDKGVDE